MKFTRFPRLPQRPAKSTGPLLTWERIRFYLIGLALMLIAFVAGFYFFFPNEVLRERLEREIVRGAKVDVRIGELSLLFPPGLKAERIRLPLTLPGRTALDIDTASAQPLWLSVLSGNPGAAFQARLLGGEITGRARQNGFLDVQAGQLAFSQPLMEGSALELSGALNEARFTGTLPPAGTNESRLELLLSDLQLKGLESLAATNGTMLLGRLVCKAEGRGNNLRIEQLEMNGGVMQVTGTGSLMLNQPIARSRINLNLTMRPAANFDRTLRDLLGLFANAGRDGSYTLRISGTLATPVFAK